jgi:hypothetical protein
MALTGMREDAVLMAIGDRKIRFAFDLARPGSRRAWIAVWKTPVELFLMHREDADTQPGLPKDEKAVFAAILPDAPRMEASKFTRLFAGSQAHVAGLIRSGAVTLDGTMRPVTPGRGHSPWITTESIRQFFSRRRLS